MSPTSTRPGGRRVPVAQDARGERRLHEGASFRRRVPAVRCELRQPRLDRIHPRRARRAARAKPKQSKPVGIPPLSSASASASAAPHLLAFHLHLSLRTRLTTHPTHYAPASLRLPECLPTCPPTSPQESRAPPRRAGCSSCSCCSSRRWRRWRGASRVSTAFSKFLNL